MTSTVEPTTQTASPTAEAAPNDGVASAAEALSERLFAGAVQVAEMLCICLGSRLGLYAALAEGGSQTSSELAARLGLDERYVREWLQQQAVGGLVRAEGAEPATARFVLPTGAVDVLLDETSPYYLAPLSALGPIVSAVLPQLERSFRSGDGVPYADYGSEAVALQGALNRPAFVHSLVSEWLPTLPDVEVRLRAVAQPARVADIGCGVGWAAIELAKAYPNVRIDGIDDDERSIAEARRNAAEHGVGDRVRFEVRDSAAWSAGDYDLVTFFECIHDMAHPVEALRSAREALRPGGTVLVMDERAAETFTAPGDEVERFFAAASVIWCLPQSRVAADSAAIGTLIRPSTIRSLSEAAGFHDVEELPIAHPTWRFYRLRPQAS